MSKKPRLNVWDACALLGLFNGEMDKVPGLRAQLLECSYGKVYIGVPTGATGEIVRLQDGQPAGDIMEAFLEQEFVQDLIPNRQVALLAGTLQYNHDYRNNPEMLAKLLAAGVPKGLDYFTAGITAAVWVDL